jgi:DNA-binding GntR family transcriptional regulator
VDRDRPFELTEPGRFSRATLTEKLEEAIRIDILQGVLRPGQRIRPNEITERYGVSTTPLREALQRLAAENLVALDSRLGATVAPISLDDLRDVYDMLQLLDGFALARSIQRGDAGWIAEINWAFEALADALDAQAAGDGTQADHRRHLGMRSSAAHARFHDALNSACGSPWMLRFIGTIHKHSERYVTLAMHGRIGQRRDSRYEHEQILHAAQARDSEAAVARLREHFSLTVDLIADAVPGWEGDRSGELAANDSPRSRRGTRQRAC